VTNSESEPGVERGDTRSRILHAAAAAIAERGWGAVSTRDIAERAGVNNALIHYYFGTRQQLLRAAAIDAILRDLQAPGEILARAPSLGIGLSEVIHWIRAYGAASQGARLFAETMLESTRDDMLRAALGGAAAAFRALLATRLAAEDAAPAGVSANGAAVLLAAALDGLLLHYILDPALDLAGAAAALQAFLHQSAAEAGGGDDQHD
jgi:AcrR family transcriptional regulator